MAFIDGLKIPSKVRQALLRFRCTEPADFDKVTAYLLLREPGVGKKSLLALERALEPHGIRIRRDPPGKLVHDQQGNVWYYIFRSLYNCQCRKCEQQINLDTPLLWRSNWGSLCVECWSKYNRPTV